MQEILQVHFDKELRGPEHKGQFESGFPVEHHDGPQEVLQPSLPLPNCCSREWKMDYDYDPCGDDDDDDDDDDNW